MNDQPTNDPAGPRNALARFLEEARKRLIETGARNRLIHTPRHNKRSKSLTVEASDSKQIFNLLVRDRKSLGFLPAPERLPVVREVGQAETSRDMAHSQDQAKLQTQLTSEALQKKLLGLQRDARTLEEEQGVNILFLAIGFLRWFEDEHSEVPREAPLILVPVSLSRNNARSHFRLVARDDDIATNLPLYVRLKQLGITLPEIPNSEDWSPETYFTVVRRSISSHPRWSVDDCGMLLGFFSFSKFLMYRDLAPSNWPDGSILDHPILRSLLVDGFGTETRLFPEDIRLDETFDPADLIHILDADSSQTVAIETVRKGQSLVIQGPPGTGKSQTIANLIAAAVHDGKRVLFVAEKMAALDVVFGRLVEAGLQDTCLELHSRQANKRTVIQEIERTLKVGAVGVPGNAKVERLRALRAYLNNVVTRIHRPLSPSQVTPYRALGEQVKLLAEGHPPPRLVLPESADWTEVKTRELTQLVGRLAQLTESFGAKYKHPWRGVTVLHLQPTDQMRVASKLKALAQSSAIVETAFNRIADTLGVSPNQKVGAVEDLIQLMRMVAAPPTADVDLLRRLSSVQDLERLSQVAIKGRKLIETWALAASVFHETAWSFDFASARQNIWPGVQSRVARLRTSYRKSSRSLASVLLVPLPRRAEDRLALIDQFLAMWQLRTECETEESFCHNALGGAWRGLHTDFIALCQAIEWSRAVANSLLKPPLSKCIGKGPAWNALAHTLELRYRELREHADSLVATLQLDLKSAFGTTLLSDIPISELAARTKVWNSNPELLDQWRQISLADRTLRDHGGEAVAVLLATDQIAPARAVAEFSFARAEALWRVAIARDPSLAEIDGEERSRAVSEFQNIERSRRGIVAQEVCAKHKARMPSGGMGEMAIILGEIGKRRGHLPIRALIRHAGQTLQEIKPVFLMSPISAAQFLSPGAVTFDLLIVDEASQVRPEDALGAIGRANQIVIVGDKKQLPPTAFFDRLVDDEQDEEDIEDSKEEEPVALEDAARATALESILTLCEARGMPQRMLTWHYRSRHPSLIEVSNAEFYDNRLFLPPSPKLARGEMGFCISRVNGQYDRGGRRVNEIEAKAIVEAIRQHVRQSPELSLGVATFSVSQRDLIEDMLELGRRGDADLDAFAANSEREPLFVKNLENVQGDERDTILVSVGYGPRIAGGRLESMNFGPVSSEGGERRLNVLFTRARVRCEIFVSFASGDIDLARTTKAGPRVLKRFLRFAETGMLDLPLPTGADADSPFEEAVGQAIAELGYVADAQVGSAGFRIDLAVKHPSRPGQYILAVECDGATYHSARWARERDRLRQEVLENLGWSFHRIWSTDWFHNPTRERQKLADAILRAVAKQSAVFAS